MDAERHRAAGGLSPDGFARRDAVQSDTSVIRALPRWWLRLKELPTCLDGLAAHTARVLHAVILTTIAAGLTGIACGGVSPDTRTAPAVAPSTTSATAPDVSAEAGEARGTGFVSREAANATPPLPQKQPGTSTRPAAGPLAQIVAAGAAAPAVAEVETPVPTIGAPEGLGGWQRAAVRAPQTVPARTAMRPAAQATPAAAVYSGVATYYGWDFQGLPMASGAPFDMNDPTITASNLWPLGTRLRVWRVLGGPWDATLSAEERTVYFGHSIIVTVVDRGLFVHALDLSYAAFAQLGRVAEGVIAVYIEPVP